MVFVVWHECDVMLLFNGYRIQILQIQRRMEVEGDEWLNNSVNAFKFIGHTDKMILLMVIIILVFTKNKILVFIIYL